MWSARIAWPTPNSQPAAHAQPGPRQISIGSSSSPTLAKALAAELHTTHALPALPALYIPLNARPH